MSCAKFFVLALLLSSEPVLSSQMINAHTAAASIAALQIQKEFTNDFTSTDAAFCTGHSFISCGTASTQYPVVQTISKFFRTTSAIAMRTDAVYKQMDGDFVANVNKR